MKDFLLQFGARPTPEELARYAASPQWHNGRFRNPVETRLVMKPGEMFSILYRQLTTRKQRSPRHPLPVVPFNRAAFFDTTDAVKAVWYGHSAVLLNIAGKVVFIDPMMGPDASPIAPVSTPRFSENTLALIDALPDIDLVLISHDHYDHLDYASIQRLKSKTARFAVALGVKRHLRKWGIADERVEEFDWWDTHSMEGIDITFTPTRHFSGRGLTDRFLSLWGGWALKTGTTSLWFSGDGGYGAHFKEVGRRLGPFDLAFIECGQYNERWRDLHLFPEESVQAARDAGVGKAVPVHWGAFSLALHHWKEPPESFSNYAQQAGLAVSLPQIGQVFTVGDELANQRWWESCQ